MLCEGETAVFDATTEAAVYEWQDGSELPTLAANSSGWYWVDVTDECTTVRDSIYLELTPNPEVNLGSDFTLCEEEIVLLDVTVEGASYEWQNGFDEGVFLVEEEGGYEVTVTHGNCTATDSIYISYHPNSYAAFDTTSCDEYVSPSGLYTWDESGVYQDTLSSVFGCDSILTISLEIPVLNATVSVDENVISVPNQTVNFQWFNCDFEWEEIEGETANTFEAETQGTYGVEISIGSCTVQSECTQVVIPSVAENELSSVKLFPNPATEIVFLSEVENSTLIEVYSLQGELVLSKRNFGNHQVKLPLTNLSKGVYFVRCFGTEVQNSQRVFQLVVL